MRLSGVESVSEGLFSPFLALLPSFPSFPTSRDRPSKIEAAAEEKSIDLAPARRGGEEEDEETGPE